MGYRNRSGVTQYLLPITVIISGIVLSIVLFSLLLNVNNKYLERDFDYRAKQIGEHLNDWLRLQEGMFANMRYFFLASENITPQEFNTIAGHLLEETAFRGIYWFPLEANGTLSTHPQSQVAVDVNELKETLTPAVKESMKKSLSDDGYTTLPQGSIMATNDYSHTQHLPVIQPIIKNGSKLGVLLGVLDLGNMRRSFLLPAFEDKIRSQFIPLSEQRLGIPSDNTPRSFYRQKQLNVFGDSWLLTVEPTAAYINNIPNYIPWITLGTGIVITGAIGMFLFHLLGRNMQIEQQVDERTRALQRATTALEARSFDLEKAKTAAVQANHSKSEFLANMSHEIRTPLNSMIGMTELLLGSELTPYQQNHANTVLASAENLLEIINDILDFSKIEAGKLTLENTPLDLRVIAEETVELFATKARSKGGALELVLDFAPDLPRYMIGDAVRIRQILFNLVGNAMKFTERGFILVQFAAAPCPPGFGSKLCLKLSVKDTGIGIAPDKLKVIFDKFSQADSSTTRKFGGTGLGLSICRQLATMMHGEMGVESVVGSGSTFWCSMILSPDLAAQDIQYSQQRAFEGVNLLLVEDVAPTRKMLESTLLATGAQVYSASNADSAEILLEKQLANGQKLNVVVLDETLPGINGMDVIRRWRQRETLKDKPILLLGFGSRESDVEKAREAGCNGYLPKPATSGALLEMLGVMLKENNKTMIDVHDLASSQQKAQRSPASEYPDFGGARVLLVEDSTFNRTYALEVLQKMNCMADYAVNGLDAIEKIEAQRYDIVLMDCQMPEMDGYEASRHIRHLKELGQVGDVPVIALTANALAEDKAHCFEAGMQDYLTKPMRVKELKAMLNKWLPQTHDDEASIA